MSFLRIYVKNPREWAARMWDSYGFDYDMENFGTNSVYAWPLEGSDLSELKTALDADGIDYDDTVDIYFGGKNVAG